MPLKGNAGKGFVISTCPRPGTTSASGKNCFVNALVHKITFRAWNEIASNPIAWHTTSTPDDCSSNCITVQPVLISTPCCCTKSISERNSKPESSCPSPVFSMSAATEANCMSGKRLEATRNASRPRIDCNTLLNSSRCSSTGKCSANNNSWLPAWW